MAKIVLNDTAGGFDISSINDNFQAIQDELNNKVLYRDNPVGEVNSLQTDTDVNGKRIYNLPVPVLPSEAARLQDVINATAGIIPAQFIPFTPYSDITSANVQEAIQEVKDDVNAQPLNGSVTDAKVAVNSKLFSRITNDFHVTDPAFGASASRTEAQNKVSLQLAITAANAAGGGTVIVPNLINYGFEKTNLNTYPDFTGCTSPILVRDCGVGSTYPLPANDGMQIREFSFTPQTIYPVTFTAALLAGATSGTLTANWGSATGPWPVTFSNGDLRYVTFTNGATTATWSGGLASAATASATYILYGQHDGNALELHGEWAPVVIVSNDANIQAVGHPTRTAADNRRASFATMRDGFATWQLGQGVKVGHTLTDEELTDFQIIKFEAPGDTLGSYAVMIVERKTGNISYGGGRTIPNAHHHFEAVAGSPTLPHVMVEARTSMCSVVMRNSAGAGQDIEFRNNSGSLGIYAKGYSGNPLVTVDGGTGRTTFVASVKLSKANIVYSASMTPNCDAYNIQQIFVNDATPFTINAPSGTPSDGVIMKIRISNISGAPIGAVTWAAGYKLSAWTQPAAGFGKTITFYYDSATPGWIQDGGAPVDVPN